MKKIFNGLGVFGSIILAIVLSFTIFTYVIILNVKFAVSEKGMAKTFMKMDIVESIKLTENGTMWEDFMQLAEKLNLNEEQFEKILNSDKVKEEVGSYIGEALESTFNDKTIYLTEERIENFLNIAIDEYNEVSDTKISESERNNIIKSFDQEIITNINEAFGNINLKETIPNEYAEHIEFADNVLFGNFSLYLLIIIIFIIGLIALLRFSYYKWMPYVMTSIIISGILIFIIGLLLLIIPLQDMEILMPLKKILLTRLFISSAILFIITIILGIGKKYIKKIIKERTTIEKQNEEKKEEKQIKETKRKLDKKTFIIIMLALILLSIILFLVFGRKGSYTITFDTNGGTEITSIKVKNGEIVTLPEVPKKEDYIFAGWKNEEGKIITKGTKVKDDITLTAEWISNNVETNTIKFNTDGGNEIDNIIIEKGKNITFPVVPTRDGYRFVGWFDENDNFITENMIVSKDITLKAMWVKKNVKTSTITFNTDGGSKVGNIIVENGKIVLLPINPTKTGYVFAGWVDEKGNAVTKDTIVNKNITLKATWKNPFSCPSNCTPIGDGSKCTKEVTTNMTTIDSCPSGYSNKGGTCVDLNTSFPAESGEYCKDGSVPSNGSCPNMKRAVASIYECAGNEYYDGTYCIPNATYTWVCPSGYNKYTETEGLGAVDMCAKTTSKVSSQGCPSGYNQSGNICKKIDTLSCKVN